MNETLGALVPERMVYRDEFRVSRPGWWRGKRAGIFDQPDVVINGRHFYFESTIERMKRELAERTAEARRKAEEAEEVEAEADTEESEGEEAAK